MVDETLSVGEQLRRAREANGVTLEEAEAQTRIRRKFLQALEAGDSSVLPSVAHAKGFLRNYAYYLGLDPDTLVGQYVSASGQAPAQPLDANATRTSPAPFREPEPDTDGGETQPGSPVRTAPTFVSPEQRQGPGVPRGLGDSQNATRTARLPRPKPQPTPPPMPAPTPIPEVAPEDEAALSERPATAEIAVPETQRRMRVGSQVANAITGVLLMLGLGATVLLISRLSQVTLPEATQAANVVEAVPTRAPTNTPVPTSTPTQAAAQPQPLGFVQIVLEATQTSWVQVTADGEVVYEDTMHPGDVVQEDGVQEIVLLIGNAGGVNVIFNQADLGSLGPRGTVVERRFTADGETIAPTPTPTVTMTPTTVPTVTPRPTQTPAP